MGPTPRCQIPANASALPKACFVPPFAQGIAQASTKLSWNQPKKLRALDVSASAPSGSEADCATVSRPVCDFFLDRLVSMNLLDQVFQEDSNYFSACDAIFIRTRVWSSVDAATQP